MKGKRKTVITSITPDAAFLFVDEQESGKSLWCENIPGFYLYRQTRKAAWRFRYQDALGKIRTATIGKFPDLYPEDAAQKAYEWNKDEADPLREKKLHKTERRANLEQADARVLKTYLEGDFEAWLNKPSWTKKNAQAVRSNFTQGHLKDFLDMDMTTIRPPMITKWETELSKKGLKHSTIRRLFNDLRALLNRAVKDGVIEKNPIEKLQIGDSFKEQELAITTPEQAARRLLTGDEMKALLNGLDLFAEEIRAQRRNSRAHGKAYLPDLDLVEYPHWFCVFCRLALATGLRPSDIYTLKWEQVDLTFNPRIMKQAEKSRHVAARRGKPATQLNFELTDWARDLLRVWKKQQGMPDSGLVIPNPQTGAQLTSKAHQRPWSRVKELAGLGDELQFYALRHHYISAMVAANIPPLTIAKLVGHKSADMIEKHYSHLAPYSAKKAVDIVAATILQATSAERETA